MLRCQNARDWRQRITAGGTPEDVKAFRRSDRAAEQKLVRCSPFEPDPSAQQRRAGNARNVLARPREIANQVVASQTLAPRFRITIAAPCAADQHLAGRS